MEAVVTGVGCVLITFVTTKMILYYKYKEKKRRLKRALDELDYDTFKNIIYEIKNVDIKYNSNVYLKIKERFYFGDSILVNRELFLMKFNPNFVLEEKKERSFSKFREIIQYEISISRDNSPLDL